MSVHSKQINECYTGKYIIRCQKNMIRLTNFKGYSKVILDQMKYSRLIYNKTLYCQRTWFTRFTKIIINHYIENINKHLKEFSTHDKFRLLRELYFRKDIKRCHNMDNR